MYEYLIIDVRRLGFDQDIQEKTLNDYAKQGWRLQATDYGREGLWHWYLERWVDE